jgi:hypothetical protein
MVSGMEQDWKGLKNKNVSKSIKTTQQTEQLKNTKFLAMIFVKIKKNKKLSLRNTNR